MLAAVSDKGWLWDARDSSGEKPKLERFAIRFASKELEKATTVWDDLSFGLRLLSGLRWPRRDTNTGQQGGFDPCSKVSAGWQRSTIWAGWTRFRRSVSCSAALHDVVYDSLLTATREICTFFYDPLIWQSLVWCLRVAWFDTAHASVFGGTWDISHIFYVCADVGSQDRFSSWTLFCVPLGTQQSRARCLLCPRSTGNWFSTCPRFR